MKKAEKAGKVIIFDYDGTIVDSSIIVLKAYNNISKKYDLEVLKNMDELKKLYEKNVYESILSKGLNGDKLDDFFSEWRNSFLNEDADVKIFDGMKEVIAHLAKKNDIYVITSNSKKVILKSLQRFGIKGFKDVLGGDEEKSKVVKIGSLKKKYTNKEFYYVGDTIGDVDEARKAGVKSVGVTWGLHSKKQLENARADFVVDDPEELLEILD